MRVLWTHNWPDDRRLIGPFMWTVLDGLKRKGITVELYNIGLISNLKEVAKKVHGLRDVAKNFDIAHAQFGSLVGYVTAKLEMPRVISLRGSDWHVYKGGNISERLHASVSGILTRSSIRDGARIITMSNRMKLEVGKYVKSENIDVIPDPIDLNLFKPASRMVCRKDMFGSTSEAPWVLFNTISRSNPVKRLELALQAVEYARQEVPDLEIKIASGVQYKDMPKFIGACDVALCTSTHEGWPNSIKEALACNLPFVSTDVSDLKSIADQTHNCFISPPTAEGLGQHLLTSLMAKKEMGLRGFVEEMNPSAVADKIENIYCTLLGKN